MEVTVMVAAVIAVLQLVVAVVVRAPALVEMGEVAAAR